MINNSNCSLAIIILALSFYVGVANAKTFQGQATFSQGLAAEISEPTSNAVFRVDWKLWTLLGEPVDRMVVKWGFSDSARITIPIDSSLYNIFTPGYIVVRECNSYKHISTNSQLADEYCVPREVMQGIRVTDLKVEISFGHLGATDCYIFDAGVVNKPGFDNKLGPVSFNTPGSKEWKKSFFTCFEVLGNRYHSVSAAKKFFKINKSWNSSNTSASISEIKYNFSTVLNFIIMMEKEQEKKDSRKIDEKKYKIKKRNKISEFDGDFLEDLVADIHENDYQEELKNKISNKFDRADEYLSALARDVDKDLSITKERVSKRSLPSDKLIVVRDDTSGLYGYKLKDGPLKIDYKFVRAENFSEGLAAVNDGSKWGFINIYDEVVIPYEYETLKTNFKNGAALLENYSHEYDKEYSYTSTVKYCDGRIKREKKVKKTTTTIYKVYKQYLINKKGGVMNTTEVERENRNNNIYLTRMLNCY